MTDADLDTLRAGVLAETERRQRLAATPAQVADLAARTQAGAGGADAGFLFVFRGPDGSDYGVTAKALA